MPPPPVDIVDLELAVAKFPHNHVRIVLLRGRSVTFITSLQKVRRDNFAPLVKTNGSFTKRLRNILAQPVSVADGFLVERVADGA